MSEFGHFSARVGGVHIDGWGSGPFTISAAGRTWRFEDSDRFGPHLVTRNGDLAAKDVPSERSPFWRAHLAWVRQGRRLAEDGSTCVYEPLRPTKVRRIAGRNCEIVEQGDDDGGYEVVD